MFLYGGSNDYQRCLQYYSIPISSTECNTDFKNDQKSFFFNETQSVNKQKVLNCLYKYQIPNDFLKCHLEEDNFYQWIYWFAFNRTEYVATDNSSMTNAECMKVYAD